jgi:hypothetical protein
MTMISMLKTILMATETVMLTAMATLIHHR